MVSHLGGDDQGEVDPGVGQVRHVGLKLIQIHVESFIKPEKGGDGGDYLTNEPVEVGVSGSLNIKVAATDVVDGLLVDHEGTVDCNPSARGWCGWPVRGGRFAPNFLIKMTL